MKMPVLFVSHGAPTLSLEPGDTGAAWRKLGEQLPRPTAILIISAHWESHIPTISRAVHPETIHDFNGFPEQLYSLQYPARGAPEMAQQAALALQKADIPVQLDDTHGLDHGADLAPDGDAELDVAVTRSFRVADCLACGGVLKPRVVYFGENVAPERVAAAWSMQAASEVLLVVGSSLTVFSGFRFVRQAHRDGLPVAIVNLGPTRGDPLATLRLDCDAGPLLQAVARSFAAVAEPLRGPEVP